MPCRALGRMILKAAKSARVATVTPSRLVRIRADGNGLSGHGRIAPEAHKYCHECSQATQDPGDECARKWRWQSRSWSRYSASYNATNRHEHKHGRLAGS